MKSLGGGLGMRSLHTFAASSKLRVVGLHILPSPINPRVRWARGAKSPLAPTVPFSGMYGRQSADIGRKG